MTLALDGVKVLDVSQVAAAPMAARHLADFGADVVHVEHPVRGDSWRNFQAGQGSGTYGAPSEINYNWENYNRNKRSLTLDLSSEGGRDVITRMVDQVDVFVTNLRPFEREKFGLTYDTLRGLNPRLIYGSLTGFGQKGPDKNSPSYQNYHEVISDPQARANGVFATIDHPTYGPMEVVTSPVQLSETPGYDRKACAGNGSTHRGGASGIRVHLGRYWPAQR